MKRNYDDPDYKKWRQEVYRRDNFKCQMPGCKKRGRVQAHHIRSWSTAPALRYDVDNGISLCWTCHNEVNKHETQYAQLFIDIVRMKNGN